MDENQLASCLQQLLTAWECEVVEFKRAGNDYDTDKIGEYFSALSNEANLRGQDRAWLVFGVDDKSRTVVGSAFRMEPERLQSLKRSPTCTSHTTPPHSGCAWSAQCRTMRSEGLGWPNTELMLRGYRKHGGLFHQ